MELPDRVVQRLLDAWPVARLATRGPRGPHLVPVVFARAGGRLWSPVDGKPKRGGEPARVRHLRAEPRAALLLDHYDADWSRLWWLRVEAEATVLRAPSEAALAREPGAGDALAALRAKYPQYRETPLLGDPPTLVRLEPLRIASWCSGPRALPPV